MFVLSPLLKLHVLYILEYFIKRKSNPKDPFFEPDFISLVLIKTKCIAHKICQVLYVCTCTVKIQFITKYKYTPPFVVSNHHSYLVAHNSRVLLEAT